MLALLGTLSCQAAHAEPPSLAGPSLGGTVLDRVPIQARLEATNWWMAGEVPGGPAGDAALRGSLATGIAGPGYSVKPAPGARAWP